MRSVEVADILRVLVSELPENLEPWSGGDGDIRPGLRLALEQDRENLVVSRFLGRLTYRSRERILRLLARLKKWALNVSEIDLMDCWRQIAADHLEQREAFYIKPSRFEDWRRQMHALDEDLPALVTLALDSSTPSDKEGMKKLFDPWPTFMRGDDPQLYRELQQGLGCLHLHLSGAYPAPYYWVGLMNRRFDETKVLDLPELPEYLRGYREIDEVKRIVESVAVARLVRWKLFRLFESYASLDLAPAGSVDEILSAQPDEGEMQNDLGSWVEYRDYVMSSSGMGSDALSPALVGERWFLLRLLRELQTGQKHGAPLARWAWAYLTSKNAFLSLVQQVEGIAGFDYFEHTFRMMRWAIPEQRESCAQEIGCFLQESGAVVRLELMVAPQDEVDDYEPLIEMAKTIRHVMNGRLRETAKHLHGEVRVGLVVHFIKNYGEKLSDRENDAKTAYRIYHHTTRDRSLQQLKILAEHMRSQRSRHSDAVPVVAVDTANRELYCPPEIFAEVYHLARRELRYRRSSSTGSGTSYVVPIQATCHVGEDFASLMCGLRRIFEAVRFLGMRPGDRLGHASALGTDPEIWVNQNSTLELPLVDLLDDALFERYLLRNAGLDPDGSIRARLSDLERLIEEYSLEIFGEVVAAGVLERAWLQRGEVRRHGEEGAEYSTEDSIPDWVCLQGAILNRLGEKVPAHATLPSVRASILAESEDVQPDIEFPRDTASRVLDEYLYDRHTILRFIRTRSIVTTAMVPHVRRVQEILRRMILEEGICIESNPSSNWLISGATRHALVPAVQWLRETPEMPITVNPDDPSVFATSIENEYFFVYAALIHGVADGVSRTEALSRIATIRQRSVSASFVQ